MADIQFLRLSERWALATDGIQWIVQRARRNRNKVGGLDWRAVAFVASDKGVLQRVLREKGAVIDSEGLEALRRLPETFREWVSMPPARRFKAGHSAISGVVVGKGLPLPRNEAVTWQKPPHDIEADFSARVRLIRDQGVTGIFPSADHAER